jgi:predicted methyltransferase
VKSLGFGIVLAAFLSGCATCNTCGSRPAEAAKPAVVDSTFLPTTLELAVAGHRRSAENLTRDSARRPVETLQFFELAPNQTIVEIDPGAGWFMEILAPYLSKSGTYVAAVVRPTSGPNQGKLSPKFEKWIAKYPEAKVQMTEFALPNNVQIAPSGTADRVLTFNNVHNWMEEGHEAKAFKAFYKALKPGGILGVVQHRGDPSRKQDPKAEDGYVREDYIIKLAKAAGFHLLGKSDLNANPKDTKNYPEGVWTLPPTFELKDKDREKYAAIGESDKATLKFLKPAQR